MRGEGLGLQFGVELNADEPGMRGQFDDLRQFAVGRQAGEAQPGVLELAAIVDVDLVAVPVALADLGRAVDPGDLTALGDQAGIGAEPHGAAQVAGRVAALDHVVAGPFGHQADDRVLAAAELARARPVQAGEVPGRLDDRHLHAEADAEIGHLSGSCEAGRRDLALGAALAEAAGHQDPVDPFQAVDRALGFEDLGIEPVHLDPDVVGDAAVGQGLGQGFVGVDQAGVLADHAYGDLAVGLANAADHLVPDRQIGRAAVQREVPADLAVQALLVVAARDRVDGVDVQGLDHRVAADVAEQGDLAPRVLVDLVLGAADDHVRLDADALELLDRVLRRLGLQLAGRGDVGQQGQVDEHAALAAELVAELADRLEEGQAFDVADRAADLADHEVFVGQPRPDEVLDRVGDVGDHLDRRAQVLAAPLLGQDLRVDLPGGDVVAAPRRDPGEALVVPEVEIGLGPVVGDVDLAVLIGAHGPRIDVQIGIELTQTDLEAACLKERAEGRRAETFAEG